MVNEKMKLTASLSAWERMEIIGENLDEMLMSLGVLDRIGYTQGIFYNVKDRTSHKITSVTVDYPEKLTEENVQSLADHFGVKIIWRRKIYG